MRHYTETNSYQVLNERYSTLHLKQYLSDKEISYMESLLENKRKPKNESEKKLLELWDKNLPLIEYVDRIRSNIKGISKINIITNNKELIEATYIVKTKEPFYEDRDTFDSRIIIYKKEDRLIIESIGGVHLTYVDSEKIKNKVEEKANA